MKWMFCILIFVIMEMDVAFAQAHLKNGVYEFVDSISLDPLGKGREKVQTVEKKTLIRTLIVLNDTICYRIGEHTQTFAVSFGMQADYLLKLKHVNNGFTAENKAVKLKLVIVDDETIAVEVLAGKARYFYSGGQYFTREIALPPEKKILTFKRGLIHEDIKNLCEQEH
ncbi:hypothetical protein [Sphingobacterium siyangense]|uniref:hypothetical protein n=1 Tax=Sphingobacterium siyangense TaxID=459529 RepID=UPI0028AF3920|nr:hypothetical protein [Sphingobacterium siyangense]